MQQGALLGKLSWGLRHHPCRRQMTLFRYAVAAPLLLIWLVPFRQTMSRCEMKMYWMTKLSTIRSLRSLCADQQLLILRRVFSDTHTAEGEGFGPPSLVRRLGLFVCVWTPWCCRGLFCPPPRSVSVDASRGLALSFSAVVDGGFDRVGSVALVAPIACGLLFGLLGPILRPLVRALRPPCLVSRILVRYRLPHWPTHLQFCSPAFAFQVDLCCYDCIMPESTFEAFHEVKKWMG